MSTSTLSILVALLLAVAGLLIVGGTAYAVHRRPAIGSPLTAGLTAGALFAALVGVILTR
ncbi:hypothetical protein GCM10010232_70870 [Streptomyces amakusaensis]|uniref:Secreted protein n=1 Tax=Streptomyces amakusaensis TaxID=67271 RepID=A0ABW0AUU0_9ACTN